MFCHKDKKKKIDDLIIHGLITIRHNWDLSLSSFLKMTDEEEKRTNRNYIIAEMHLSFYLLQLCPSNRKEI
jgi:hypothetical protein